MVGLLDIADPEPDSVKVRNTDVPVYGITIHQIARVLGRFEQLDQLFKEGAMTNFKVGDLAKIAPEAIAAVIAVGTGYANAEPAQLKKAEEKAATLLPSEQFAVIKKMLEISFGDQLGPLLKRLSALADAREDKEEPVVPGKGLPSNSLRQLRKSLRSATTDEMFGATHRGSSPAMPN